MQGNVNQVYSVQGIGFSTTEMLRAITRAKDEAKKHKASRLVYLNGNPHLLIDKKGVLVDG